MTDREDKLKRLYRLVENGATDVDDVLKDRLNSLKADRASAKAALEVAKSQVAPGIRIDPALIERFGRSMREKFTAGSVPFRKAYLQSIIDVVEVDDHQIRINGRNGRLFHSRQPCLKLHMQVDGPLRNVDCNLTEDGRHALLLCEDGPDIWLGCEFELADLVSEDAFDPYKYIDAFER